MQIIKQRCSGKESRLKAYMGAEHMVSHMPRMRFALFYGEEERGDVQKGQEDRGRETAAQLYCLNRVREPRTASLWHFHRVLVGRDFDSHNE